MAEVLPREPAAWLLGQHCMGGSVFHEGFVMRSVPRSRDAASWAICFRRTERIIVRRGWTSAVHRDIDRLSRSRRCPRLAHFRHDFPADPMVLQLRQLLQPERRAAHRPFLRRLVMRSSLAFPMLHVDDHLLLIETCFSFLRRLLPVRRGGTHELAEAMASRIQVPFQEKDHDQQVMPIGGL